MINKDFSKMADYGKVGENDVAPGFYMQTIGDYIKSMGKFVDGYKELGMNTRDNVIDEKGVEKFSLYTDQQDAERIVESLQRCIDRGYLTNGTILGSAAQVLHDTKVDEMFIKELRNDDLLYGPHSLGLTNRKKEVIGSIETTPAMDRVELFQEFAPDKRKYTHIPTDYSENIAAVSGME